MVDIEVVEVRVPSRVSLVEVPIAPAVSRVELYLPGLPGPPGAGSSAYVHTQASELPTWTVAHNLGHKPSVAVFTIGSVEVVGGEVIHLDVNTLQILFDVPFAGWARCT